MRKIVIAALFATTVASPAFAQDKAPFTGVRAEGIVGWDRLSSGDDSDDGSNDGVVYGGAVGYDFQAGGAIVGVEAELTGSTNDVSATDLITTGDRFTLNAGRDIALGGRVGFLLSPTAMLYAKGAYTNARIETRYTAGTTSVRDHEDLEGYRIGAGAEVQLNPNLYLKGEYRYSHYGETNGYDFDLDRHQVLGGLGFRF